jgi:hypothetical protein
MLLKIRLKMYFQGELTLAEVQKPQTFQRGLTPLKRQERKPTEVVLAWVESEILSVEVLRAHFRTLLRISLKDPT